jgi:5,10-methylene-tetrahydrofolate dehydrogenase/methenyl tetrahydrofolate cyclohydrolase
VSNDVEAMDNVTCTPVPGGVGLLTTACLMKNTLSLYNK